MADKSVSAPEKAPVLANPAAIGLGAFGGTTLLLQFENLKIMDGVGAVMWLAIFFGGLTQLIAGFHEYKHGNNFGFAAFTTYGAFWLALAGIWLNNTYFPSHKISTWDVGWFLVIFTLLTFIYLLGAMKQHTAISMVFLTLLIGFILLDIGHLVPGAEVFNKIAGGELIICTCCAWYLMCHVILNPLKYNIPVGKAWLK